MRAHAWRRWIRLSLLAVEQQDERVTDKCCCVTFSAFDRGGGWLRSCRMSFAE